MKDVDIINFQGWCFITYKQKSLVQASDSFVPNAEHKHFLRQLYNNFKLQFNNLLIKNALLSVAKLQQSQVKHP